MNKESSKNKTSRNKGRKKNIKKKKNPIKKDRVKLGPLWCRDSWLCMHVFVYVCSVWWWRW